MATSDLVQELSARFAQSPKVATTVRLDAKIFDRLKKQEKKWGTTMSFIIERALAPVLDELEQARVPIAHDGAAVE